MFKGKLKSRNVVITGIVVVIIFTIGIFNFYGRGDDGVKQAVLEAIISSDEVRAGIGVVPVEDILENIEDSAYIYMDTDVELLAEVEIEELLEETKGELEEVYYEEGRINSLLETRERALKAFAEGDLKKGVSVGAGSLNPEILHFERDGDSAVMTVRLVGWLNVVEYDEETGEYYIWLIFNRDTITDRLVLDEGSWKVIENLNFVKDFAPDGYNYEKGTFATFAEAAREALQIVVKDENPF